MDYPALIPAISDAHVRAQAGAACAAANGHDQTALGLASKGPLLSPVSSIRSPSETPQGPGGVVFMEAPMPAAPSIKRTMAFFDGQNLFHAAKAAFGHARAQPHGISQGCASKGPRPFGRGDRSQTG